MKITIVYYFIISAPLLLLFVFADSLSSSQIFIGLVSYVILYRPLVDYLRLKSKNQLNEKSWWKVLLPFGRIKYAKELYS